MNVKTVNILLVYVVVLLFLQDQASGCPRRRQGSPPSVSQPPAQPTCSPRNCEIKWSSWSSCSHKCGNSRVHTRTVHKTETESCGGTCTYPAGPYTKQCEGGHGCQNRGTPTDGGCLCLSGWSGTCCETGEHALYSQNYIQNHFVKRGFRWDLKLKLLQPIFYSI